jgi:hypothetical protein
MSLEYWIARSSRAMTVESVACVETVIASNDVKFQMRLAFPRREAPEVLQKPFAQINRGRRECRALNAPAASRAK